ncbi:MAG: putative membrane protein, partial [Flavobacteriales bacterium]
TIDTILISWFITGETTVALSIGAVEVVTKMLLYYVHERLWERFFFKTRNQR